MSTKTLDLDAAPLVALRRELEAAGLPTRSALRGFTEFFSFLAGALALISVAVWSAPHPVAVGLAAIGGVWLWMAAILCGHDAAHGSVCPKPWQNALLARLSFTLVGGLSLPLWKVRHARHHAHPRVHGRDPEIEHGGLFVYSRSQHLAQPAALRALHRVQAPAFWVLGALLISPEVRVSSLVHTWQSRRRSWTWARDVAWLLAHYLLTFAVPALLLGVKATLVMHAIGEPLIGVFLVLMFAPGHLATGAGSEEDDELDRQVRVSRNFRAPLGLNRFMNGLGRHVEHHVAPYLSHFDFDRAEPIIRQFLAARGHAVEQTSWASALASVHRKLGTAWRDDDAAA